MSKLRPKDLTVIIPFYNEEPGLLDEIIKPLYAAGIDYIIVDDGSTVPLEYDKSIRRKKNKGYGAAIKYGIYHAKTQYVGLLDADNQYKAKDIVRMWEFHDQEDMIIGRRMINQGGPRRLLGRLFLKVVAFIFTGDYIPDLNSGIRIFKRTLAKKYFSILCDEFSFTTSLTISFILDKYKVRWIDVGFYPREGTSSTVHVVRHGLITLWQIVRISLGLRTRRFRAWLRK